MSFLDTDSGTFDHRRSPPRLKRHGPLELHHLCDVAQDERGWEKVRNYFLSHSVGEAHNAIFQQGEDGTTAIHMACKNCAPIDIIEMMLNSCEKSLEFRDEHGWSPLHYACHFGCSEEVIKVLILSCPKALKKEDAKGRNPLHFAVGNKHKSKPFNTSTFLLLTQGGSARKSDSKGMLVSIKRCCIHCHYNLCLKFYSQLVYLVCSYQF